MPGMNGFDVAYKRALPRLVCLSWKGPRPTSATLREAARTVPRMERKEWQTACMQDQKPSGSRSGKDRDRGPALRSQLQYFLCHELKLSIG